MASILFYSSQIFSSETDPDDIYSSILVSILHSKVALMVGAVSLGSTLLALPMVECLGRKLILVLGFSGMGIAILLTGVFEELGMRAYSEGAVLVFLFWFFFSAGPIFWIYLPEALNDGGVKLGAASNWLSVIVISMLTPQLQKLNQWMFYLYAIFNGLVISLTT